MLKNNFSYTQLCFVFLLQKDSVSITIILTLFFFFFFRMILISVPGLFLPLFFFFFKKIWYLLRVSFQNFSKYFEFQNFSKHFREYVRTENRSHKIAWNYLKLSWIVSIIFSRNFPEYIRTESPSYKTAWNHLKVTWTFLNTIFFNLKNCSKNFRDYISMENLDYKNQNTDRKQPFRSRKIFYGIEG